MNKAVSCITKNALFAFMACLIAANSLALSKSRTDLEYGTVLFDYYQQNYLDALIEHEYNLSLNNKFAKSSDGNVLQGGMMLSYSMPDYAHDIFQNVLNDTQKEATRNRAWYYLAKLHYSKSDLPQAANALTQVHGRVPKDIHLLYHYLATLINISGDHLGQAQKNVDKISTDTPYYPYLLFNMAIGHLRNQALEPAVDKLEKVTAYSGQSEELSVLADRAKHGLSQLAIQAGHYPQAWLYLKGIRTTGLYSNRALLTYAWSAIKLKRFNDAIPALEILSERSIAIPEVQEGKVLLSHLYEQEGSPRKALKANLLAEKAFEDGMAQVKEAREIIALRDVPREFIANMEAIVGSTDWYAIKPSVNYDKLTPFLIDLMASHAFNETLTELADLYLIRSNLNYWAEQAAQHRLILKNAAAKSFDERLKERFDESVSLRDRLTEQSEELKLYTLALDVKDQERFQVLLTSMNKELNQLDEKVIRLQSVDEPYQPPPNMDAVLAQKHEQIQKELVRTEKYINMLEPIMRALVNAELDKHEERMRYYWAQSRLAKARLYDSTLLELERARGSNAVE